MASAGIRLRRPCVLSVLLLNFCSAASSLYFELGGTERKCFLQEIPDGTTILGDFQAQLYDHQRDEDPPATQDLGIVVVAKDPDDEVVLSQSYGSEGSFNFTSWKQGRYQICLQSNFSQRPLSAGGLLTVHLDIRVGERTNSYTDIAAENKPTQLMLSIQQLAKQVQQIQREQVNQRFREKHFREVNLSTNMWIFWWSAARSLYVVAIVIWCTNSWSQIRLLQ